MELIVEILTLIVCILLIMVVLVQDSKGGGLSSSFGASNQILGVRKTTDFLEKATWVLAISLLVLSLSSAYFIQSGGNAGSGSSSSITHDRAQSMNPGNNNAQPPAPSQAPPAAPPAGTGSAPSSGTGTTPPSGTATTPQKNG